MKMFLQQGVQVGCVYLWQLKWQANSFSNGFAIREYSCLMRHLHKCNVGMRIVEGPEFMQLELFGMHYRQSHVTPPRRALLETIEDTNWPPELVDSDHEVDEEDEDDEDGEEDNVDADDDDSGNDRAQVSADEAQHTGM